MTAATIISIISGTSIVGRIAMGTVSDWMGRHKVLAMCVFTQGAMMLWLVGASSVWMFFLFAIVYGLGYGGHGPQLPALAGETLGLRNMGAILGSLNCFWAIGGAVGPIVAGSMIDATGGYNGAFIIGAVAMFIATVLSFMVKVPKILTATH